MPEPEPRIRGVAAIWLVSLKAYQAFLVPLPPLPPFFFMTGMRVDVLRLPFYALETSEHV